MRRFLLSMLSVAILLGLLCSCGKGAEIPEGLALLSDGNCGFTLYCPDGWSNVSAPYNGDETVYAARLTGTSKTSMSFVKSDMPNPEIDPAEEGVDPTLARIKVYFDESVSGLPKSVADTLTVTKAPEAAAFGNAPKAYKTIYTYKYEDFNYELGDFAPTDFTTMQIFVINGEDFYIFTYTAYGKPDSENEEDDYVQYLDEIQLAIDSFSFNSDEKKEAEEKEYLTDSDGYKLVSDEKLCGFELYLPDNAKVVASSGYVEARLSEGASVSLSRATDTGVVVSDYWKLRKENLSRICDNVTEIEIDIVNGEGERRVILGNLSANRVAAYEYTYDFGGVTYRVYQIMGVDSFNGYVFTYTARAEEYEGHLDVIEKILEKVKF